MQKKFLINLKNFNFDKGLNRCWIVFTICWFLITPFLFFTDSINYPYRSFEKLNITTKEQLSFRLGKAIEIYRKEIINNHQTVVIYLIQKFHLNLFIQTPEALLKMFGGILERTILIIWEIKLRTMRLVFIVETT